MNTGQILRELRKNKKLTLREVSHQAGIAWSGLGEIERGERSCNSTTLKILSDFYNVSTDYLLGNENTDNETDIKVAFYNQHGIVSQEQIKEVENFIEYVKSKK